MGAGTPTSGGGTFTKSKHYMSTMSMHSGFGGANNTEYGMIYPPSSRSLPSLRGSHIGDTILHTKQQLLQSFLRTARRLSTPGYLDTDGVGREKGRRGDRRKKTTKDKPKRTKVKKKKLKAKVKDELEEITSPEMFGDDTNKENMDSDEKKRTRHEDSGDSEDDEEIVDEDSDEEDDDEDNDDEDYYDDDDDVGGGGGGGGKNGHDDDENDGDDEVSSHEGENAEVFRFLILVHFVVLHVFGTCFYFNYNILVCLFVVYVFIYILVFVVVFENTKESLS